MVGVLAWLAGTGWLAAGGALPPDPSVPGIPVANPDRPGPVPCVAAETDGVVCVAGGGMEVRVRLDPFGFAVGREGAGAAFLKSGGHLPWTGFAPLAHTRDFGVVWNRFYWGYRGFLSVPLPWARAVRATAFETSDGRVSFTVETHRPSLNPMCFVVGPFYDGAVRLAASARPGAGTFGRTAFTFRTGEDERFAGFGERFNAVNQRGNRVSCWAEEGSIEPGLLRRFRPDWPAGYAVPGGTDAAYAPIPFFLSSRGYGVLADVAEPTHFDMAARFENLWRVHAESDALSLVVFAGPTPAEALTQYTAHTGRSLIPRPWVFAPWNMLGGYRQGGALDVARLFREHDIPSSVAPDWGAILPLDSWLGREDAVKAQNEQFHALGFKRLCYIQPRVDRRHAKLWEQGKKLGHFVKNAAGDPYVLRVFVNLIHRNTFHIALVDFTHEGVDAWWHKRLERLVELGFDGTMYDFGEYVPPDAQFADGRTGHFWHNAYNLLYLRSAFRFFEQLDDDPGDAFAPDYVYFHRSGYAGSQRWAWAAWSGDPEADWSQSDGLRAQVCAGINAGLSGLPYWGSDTGGFHAILVPPPDTELLVRWIQFAAFSGLMRDVATEEFRGARRLRILDDPEVLRLARRYQKLRTQLVPYIVNCAHEAHKTGLPLMRAAFLEFPGDPKCWTLEHAYCFGPDLFVAPVVAPGARTRRVYLPPGPWIPLWRQTEYDEATGGFRIGGAPIDGGRETTVEAPLDAIPVFVRLGAVLPVADPCVDTWAPAAPPQGIAVTTAQARADRLHIWAFPKDLHAAALADGSNLGVAVSSRGVTLTRTGGADGARLIAQVVWPPGLSKPERIEGMTPAPGADPLALEPGAWTWSETRRAAALHGPPGRRAFLIATDRQAAP